jgi:pseudoazurin
LRAIASHIRRSSRYFIPPVRAAAEKFPSATTRNNGRATRVLTASKQVGARQDAQDNYEPIIADPRISAAGNVTTIRSGLAAEYEIKMLDHGDDGMMMFDPELLKIAPGDTVHFLATDKDHNTETIPGMIPDGAKPFASQIGQDFKVTLTVPGVYGYRCSPHGSLGMVGLIVVGSPVNEAQAKEASVPGLAPRTFTRLFDALDAQRTAHN